MKKKRIYKPSEFSPDLKFQKEIDGIYEQLNDFSEKIKSLKNNLKKLESSYTNDLNKVHKMRRINGKPKKESGFVAKREVPEELAKFIKADKNISMSLPEYTKKFCEELKNRNLIYENDKRVYRADRDIMKIFGFTDEVNKSINPKDKNGFNFGTLQKHINSVFAKHNNDHTNDITSDINSDMNIDEIVNENIINKNKHGKYNKNSNKKKETINIAC